MPEVDIATRLRLVRREYGRIRGGTLTQQAMAEAIGVQKATYQSWEAGNSLPRDIVTTAKRIAEVTGVDVAWILGLSPAYATTRIGNRWTDATPGGNGDCSNGAATFRPFAAPSVAPALAGLAVLSRRPLDARQPRSGTTLLELSAA